MNELPEPMNKYME